MTDRPYFVSCDAVGSAPVEMFSLESQKQRLVTAANDFTESVKDLTQNAKFWLPIAAEKLSLSKNISDYVLTPVISMPSDLPNRNIQAFPYKELTAWCIDGGNVMYKTWVGKSCVSGDTRVPTEKGLIPIDSINKYKAKKVLTKDGVADIKKAWRTKYTRTMNVYTKSGRKLKSTSDHEYLVLGPDCEFYWVEAKNLKKDDILVIRKGSLTNNNSKEFFEKAHQKVKDVHNETFTFVSKTGKEFIKPKHQIVKSPKFPKTMTRELARILGYLGSEGHTVHNVSFYNSDLDLIRDFSDCWFKCFGLKPIYGKERMGNIGNYTSKKILHHLHSNKKDIKEYLHSLGLEATLAPYKRVPQLVFNSNKKFIKEYLKTYIEGDGCLTKNSVIITTSSSGMAQDLQALCVLLGFTSTIRKSKIDLTEIYYVSIHNASEFIKLVGTVSKRREILANSIIEGELNKRPTTGNRFSIPYVKDWIYKEKEQYYKGKGFRQGKGYYDIKGKALKISLDIWGSARQNALPEQVKTWAKEMGKIDKKYKEKLNTLIGDFVFEKFAYYSYNLAIEPVYDISTSAGQFVANGIVIHNCFTEHQNKDPLKSRGIIVDCVLKPLSNTSGDIWKVIKLLAWDRNKDPMLVNNILSKKENAYSMGAHAQDFSCSVCAALTSKGGCEHLQFGQPPKFNVFNGRLAYFNVLNPIGFECSHVKTPAYQSAITDHHMAWLNQ